MKKESGTVIYSPRDLIRYLASPDDYDYEQEPESYIPSLL